MLLSIFQSKKISTISVPLRVSKNSSVQVHLRDLDLDLVTSDSLSRQFWSSRINLMPFSPDPSLGLVHAVTSSGDLVTSSTRSRSSNGILKHDLPLAEDEDE